MSDDVTVFGREIAAGRRPEAKGVFFGAKQQGVFLVKNKPITNKS